MANAAEQYDFIIVGAGSAGCVLANRLSAHHHRVLLLEAGGSDRKLWIQMPLGYGKTFFDPAVNWMYQTEPNAGLNQRSSYWPRGKVLGGSSSINAMVYLRGLPTDYDQWCAAGNPGWSWQDVLPYFKRSEDYERGESAHHGAGGLLHVTDMQQAIHPLCQHFFQAAHEQGIPFSDDLNGAQTHGVGAYAINTRGSFRASTANAFLRPAMRRPHLTVRTHAQVTRILFNTTDSSRLPVAEQVAYLKGQQIHYARARCEIILCGGSINSPQLLQLSGVGDPKLLKAHAIPVVAARRAVGKNLQDHLVLTHYYRCYPKTLNDALYPWWGKVKAGLQYFSGRRGILAMSVNQCGGFVRSSAQEPLPNLQLYFNPLTYDLSRQQDGKMLSPAPYSAFSMSFNPCRPSSRGQLAIHSPDPLDKPRIHPEYLSTEHDRQEAISGYAILRQLANSPALAEIIQTEEQPGSTIQTADECLEDFRQRCNSIYHPVGSCSMGPDPEKHVVNAHLQVHGVKQLRVVDASIFPAITSGNTNAPTIMVAEKGADLILQLLK